jgi:phosphoadenosine phosphosulfate reductase
VTPVEAILERRRTRSLPIVTAPAGGDAPELPDFEGAPADEILRWAFGEFGLEVVLASSMQDSVLIDLAWKVEPRVEVFFLDTGFHFYETLATAKAVRKRYNLNLVMLDPVDDPAVWSEEGYKACCAARKVAPMNNYLRDKRAWMSGLRRAESETRAHAKAVEWDASRGLVKINPIVEWTDEQVDRYIADNDLIVNSLRLEGYDSIGCVPCTIPGNGREGRWAGSLRVECGIHQVHPAVADPPEPLTPPA